MEWWIRPEMYYVKRYLRFLRREEKFTFQRPNKLLCFWYLGRENRLGSRLGFIISANTEVVKRRIHSRGNMLSINDF